MEARLVWRDMDTDLPVDETDLSPEYILNVPLPIKSAKIQEV